jgi:protein gp37
MKAAGPPQLVFIDSMSDLMGHWVPEPEVRTVLETMAAGSHNTFQALTKNPRRYLRFADDLPGNLWAGASSAPDFFMGKELSPVQQRRYMEVALESLAAVREQTGNIVWMSIEPLSWDVADIVAAYPALDWVVIGAASDGPRYFQPDARHVDRLLDVLDGQGVPVFYKGNIEATFETYDFGTAAKNRWREDFPVRPSGRGATAIPGPAPAVVRRQAQARVHGWTLNTLLPEVAPEPTPAAPVAVQPALFG